MPIYIEPFIRLTINLKKITYIEYSCIFISDSTLNYSVWLLQPIYKNKIPPGWDTMYLGFFIPNV